MRVDYTSLREVSTPKGETVKLASFGTAVEPVSPEGALEDKMAGLPEVHAPLHFSAPKDRARITLE